MKFFLTCIAVITLAITAIMPADAGLFGNGGGLFGLRADYSSCSSASYSRREARRARRNVEYASCSSGAMRAEYSACATLQPIYSPPPVPTQLPAPATTSINYQPVVHKVSISRVADPAPTPQ